MYRHRFPSLETFDRWNKTKTQVGNSLPLENFSRIRRKTPAPFSSKMRESDEKLFPSRGESNLECTKRDTHGLKPLSSDARQKLGEVLAEE